MSTDLHNRFRPKTYDEYVGSPEVLKKLEKLIMAGICIILYGPPGTGKTSVTYLVADRLGMQVVEFNASDQRDKDTLLSLRRSVKMKTFIPVVYLLDEADGLKNWDIVGEILKVSKRSIILTVNDLYKIPADIQKLCQKIQFYRPRFEDVAKRVRELSKKEKVKLTPGTLSRDVRSSILASFYGGDVSKTREPFEIVRNVFTDKPIKEYEGLNAFWFLDNVHSFYTGRDLYRAVMLICASVRNDRPEMLRFLPKGRFGQVNYPQYLRKLRMVKESE